MLFCKCSLPQVMPLFYHYLLAINHQQASVQAIDSRVASGHTLAKHESTCQIISVYNSRNRSSNADSALTLGHYFNLSISHHASLYASSINLANFGELVPTECQFIIVNTACGHIQHAARIVVIIKNSVNLFTIR